MNEAREKADRRQENEAVRKAEHPEATNQTAHANPAPAAQAAPVEAAPVAPAAAPAAAPAQ